MDKDGKTEKPTPKRKRDARKKGNVARSPDLTAALALLTFSFIFIPAWQFGLGKFFPYMTGFIEQLDNYQVLSADLPKVGLQAILMVFPTMLALEYAFFASDSSIRQTFSPALTSCRVNRRP